MKKVGEGTENRPCSLKGEIIYMTKLDDFIEEQLQNPVFKEKYDALEPEFVVMQAIDRCQKRKRNDSERIICRHRNITS